VLARVALEDVADDAMRLVAVIPKHTCRAPAMM
jgi:hypothetical protein